MLKVWGSSLCPDCVVCKKSFDAENVEYEFFDISANLQNLKKFLVMRDSKEKFAKAKEKGLIGIPIIETEDGTLTFKWQEFVKNAQTATCNDGVCGVPQK